MIKLTPPDAYNIAQDFFLYGVMEVKDMKPDNIEEMLDLIEKEYDELKNDENREMVKYELLYLLGG